MEKLSAEQTAAVKKIVEDNWRIHFGGGNLSTELWNRVFPIRSDMMKEIDAIGTPAAPASDEVKE